MRHNWKKYQKRRSIRNEWKRRLHDAWHNSNQCEYAWIVTEYMIVTNKIRRYYYWLRVLKGRTC